MTNTFKLVYSSENTMENQDTVEVKLELKDDYIVDYQAIPSPEMPIYALIPIRNILPVQVVQSSTTGSIGHSVKMENANMVTESDFWPKTLKIATETVPENATTQASENQPKTYRNASTNTCIVGLESLYGRPVCRVCYLPIRNNTVKDQKKLLKRTAKPYEKARMKEDIELEKQSKRLKEYKISCREQVSHMDSTKHN